MTTFGFSAFLKLANLPAPRQRAIIRQRVAKEKRKGYDFHKEMRSICHRHLVEGLSLEDCLREAQLIVQRPERESAIAAIGKLVEWRREIPGDVFAVAPRIYETPRRVFKVRMDVDFGVLIGSDRIAIHLWNTKKPNLDLRLTRAALALFPPADVSLDDVAVLSLRSLQLIRLGVDTEVSVVAERMIDALEEIFLDLRRGSGIAPGAEDRPAP